ncbi:MotE family protein [Antarctobacter jejuensis]|uniref:MotE family protein n=1 Tax=Antarctobacter jejuensis TaxID=1439938 RepID=UPI003FD0CF48
MGKPTVQPSAKAAKPARRKPRRKSRGALAAICALLVTSGLLRLAVGASEAIAREGPLDEVAPDPAAKQIAAKATPDPASGAGPEPILVAEADLAPLVAALNAREARIRERETAIDVRMQALAVAEEEISRKLKALEEAEDSLRSTLALARTAAEDDIAKLTDVYANMKPKQAAALFEEMDPEFAAGFLGRMRPDAAAAIMAGMTPQAAYLTSVILAGRNANVPKE